MRRLNYLIAALLGFSTACSTARQVPRDRGTESGDTERASVCEADSLEVPPRIVVMYGPPRPRLSEGPSMKRMAEEQPDSLPDSLPAEAAGSRGEDGSVRGKGLPADE